MKFSEMIRLITISILREITDASEQAPLFYYSKISLRMVITICRKMSEKK